MNARSSRVAHNDASTRIGDDTVRTNQRVKVGLAGNQVEGLGPKTPLGLDLPFNAEDAFVFQVASAVEQEVGEIESQWGASSPCERPRPVRRNGGKEQENHAPATVPSVA